MLIERWADAIAAGFDPGSTLNIVGILTRGHTLANRLEGLLRKRGFRDTGRGTLDITLYRDDLTEVGPTPMVRPSSITIDIDARPLLLVDDVLFTGRSVRAALGALNDYGRPSVIRLAVLVDRGGRELPIAADFVGLRLDAVARDERVNVLLSENDEVDRIAIQPRA